MQICEQEDQRIVSGAEFLYPSSTVHTSSIEIVDDHVTFKRSQQNEVVDVSAAGDAIDDQSAVVHD